MTYTPNGFGGQHKPGYVQEQFLGKAVIFLAVINASAVVIAEGDVVLRPGPKCLDTTIDLVPVGVYSPFSGSIYGDIYTMRQKHWTQLKETQQQ